VNEFSATEWQRAHRSLASACQLVDSDPDSAASRAYYAAFHAACALFAFRGQTYSKHSALRAAVHRELVHSGLWKPELGRDYDYLMDLRETGDYGGLLRVTPDAVRTAIAKAGGILQAVGLTCPDLKTPPGADAHD
jgi:uncharacterized protein (UPF0332 family)